ncbi:MAG: YlbF family regulator [Candidatus Choladocola sp.]|nr:YlbF family regulator [Candidatus Choladocola sp.]
MGQIEDCTNNLIEAILNSSEYRHFCEIRDQVKEEPELRAQINAFRRHVFEVQNSDEPLDMYDEQARLCKDYEEFRKNPLVNDFLQSELRVCRIIQKTALTIVEKLDLDTQDVTEGIKV